MSTQSCPTPEDLAGFLNEKLDAVRRAEIRTHVNTCEHCQQALEALTRAQAYGLSALDQTSSRRFTGWPL